VIVIEPVDACIGEAKTLLARGLLVLFVASQATPPKRYTADRIVIRSPHSKYLL
jgi:hypothetical protein